MGKNLQWRGVERTQGERKKVVLAMWREPISTRLGRVHSTFGFAALLRQWAATRPYKSGIFWEEGECSLEGKKFLGSYGKGA